MSLLVVMPVPPSWCKNWKGKQLGVLKDSGPLVPMLFWILEQLGLDVEITLHKLAQFFAVFVVHVHKFHAAAVRADASDHGCNNDVAQADAYHQLGRICIA